MSVSYPLALLVPTKLAAPQPRSVWVRRERLLARLGAIVHARLTLLVAPAGYGKSTLVAQWLQDVERRTQTVEPPDSEGAHPALRSILHAWPSAWLTLDEYDQDGLRFLAHVVGAVARVCPNALTNTLPLLAAQEPPPLYLALQALLVDLSALPGGLTLILDDYHTVVTPEIHQVVTYLLRHLPPACHLVILSRSDPPFTLARLRADQQIAEFRASDLRFSLDETAALVTNLLGHVPTAALVSSLQQETEGWAIALQLAVLAQQEAGARDRTMSIARRLVAEYLAEEVFDRQPEPMREVLLALAVPECFCVGLAAALLGAPDDLVNAEARIAGVLHANLLLIPLEGAECWYRFHPLFRYLLLRRLRLQVAPQAIAALELCVARWLEREGLSEQPRPHDSGAEDESADADVVECLPTAHTDMPTWEAHPLPAASARSLPERLTKREHAILAYLAERWSDKEIAACLVITPNTVRKHTSNIFGKLGVSNRREAVTVAHALGLLTNAS